MAIPSNVENLYQQAVDGLRRYISGTSDASVFAVLSLADSARTALLGVRSSSADSAVVDIYLQTLDSLIVQAQVKSQYSQKGQSSSAGQIVADDSIATVPFSATQHPLTEEEVLTSDGRIETVPDTSSGSNAVTYQPDLALDFGTDAELRPWIQTQAVDGENNIGGAPLTDPSIDGREFEDASFGASPGGESPGVGAGGDDFGGKNVTRSELDTIFSDADVPPQPNVLAQYASYTYVASLYLMNKDSYAQMMRTKRKQLNGAQLLMQSGGAAAVGRNPYFSNDYYIDKIVLNSAITGKGTNAAHNVNNVKLTVVEPNGITLINNLDRAVQDYLGSVENKKRTFTSQLYLLVIKFYGYDDNGNLVRGGTARYDGYTDANAFVEKWYPLAINAIDFKVSNKLVEYEISATSPSYQTATSSNRGTIPYNVELSGETVNDVISGPAQYSLNGQLVGSSEAVASTTVSSVSTNTVDDTYDPELNLASNTATSAPPKADAAPSKRATVRQGLMAALNEYQMQLVKDGLYSKPDVYSIEYANPSIKSAKIKKPGTLDKARTSMATGKNAADQKLPDKQSTDTNSRIETITAGTQIVQALDKIVRNSFYIQDQQITVFDPVTGKEIYNGTPADNVAYFKISVESTPREYDPKRNDYAYDIKYIVSAYKINEAASNYFYVPKVTTPHKSYKYWFTGENSEVLSYEQNYNALYTSVLSGGSSSPATVINDAIKFNASPRSGMTSQGALGKANEPAANLADFLFNPGDLANATMQIIGDPAWLQQGEAFAGLSLRDPRYFSKFLSDGTINFESQQILFEIFINTPKDYDMSTGIIDPNKVSAYGGGTFQMPPGSSQQSYLYRANECISEFNKGKFTQTLKGSLITFYPNQTFKANQTIAANLQQGLLAQLSLQRLGLAGAINIGSFTSLPFLSNLPSISGAVNSAINFGSNYASSVASDLIDNTLGRASTMFAKDPSPPTSFNELIEIEPLNNDTGYTDNSFNFDPPQIIAGSDDSGDYGSDLSDLNDFFG